MKKQSNEEKKEEIEMAVDKMLVIAKEEDIRFTCSDEDMKKKIVKILLRAK